MDLEIFLKKSGQHDLWPFLKPHEQHEVRRLLNRQPVLWSPRPGPQTDAYYSEADELFYGGRAGAGKSDLVLGLAATAHTQSLILRRETTQLLGLYDRSQDLLSGLGRWNGQMHTWRNLPGGRTIEFGGCVHEQDKQNYKGRPHDFISFDELPDFTESQYIFICAWNRTIDPKQRVRIVNTGNPPSNAEGEWVIRRWGPWLDSQHAHPAEPGELRWFVVIDGKEVVRENGTPFMYRGEMLQPKSRTFIPGVMIEDLRRTGYAATLQNMPEPLRSQLLYGDFSVGMSDHRWQILPTEWVRLAQSRWTPDGGKQHPLSVLGQDIARGGEDQTIVAKRYGPWVAPLQKTPGKETPDGPASAACVVRAVGSESFRLVNVDVIGVGGAAYDFLRSTYGSKVVAVNFASGSSQRDKSGQLGFLNVRAEAYWRLREALDPNSGQDIALPPDPELLADLCAARWKLTPRGIQVEEKEEIRKRLGRSPDCGDAVLLAFYEVQVTSGIWGR